MTENQQPEPLPSKDKRTEVDWQLFKQRLEQFLTEQTKIVAILLTFINLVSPQLLSNAEAFDTTLCSLREIILENARTTSITCTDANGQEFELNLEFLITYYDIGTYPDSQIDNPPFLAWEYASNIMDPNYNCHSLTLQLIQERASIELGASQERWLNQGLDAFLENFGETLLNLEQVPQPTDQNIIEAGVARPGDVVLFFDHQGELIHSATVVGHNTTEEGEQFDLIRNKLGMGPDIYSSIANMVNLYDIWGEYDEITRSGGGNIRVVRPDITKLQTAFEARTGFEPVN